MPLLWDVFSIEIYNSARRKQTKRPAFSVLITIKRRTVRLNSRIIQSAEITGFLRLMLISR